LDAYRQLPWFTQANKAGRPTFEFMGDGRWRAYSGSWPCGLESKGKAANSRLAKVSNGADMPAAHNAYVAPAHVAPAPYAAPASRRKSTFLRTVTFGMFGN